MGEAYQIRNQEGIYFLTFQVVGWADIFSRKIYKDTLIESMLYYKEHKGLLVFAYVIMTNHVHVIWKAEFNNLSDLIRDFKKRSSRLIMKEVNENIKESRKEWLLMIFRYHARFNKRNSGLQFWTHENHAVELTYADMIDQRINYIHENPVKAGWVEKAEEYLYSSAKNFADEKGLLEIDKI